MRHAPSTGSVDQTELVDLDFDPKQTEDRTIREVFANERAKLVFLFVWRLREKINKTEKSKARLNPHHLACRSLVFARRIASAAGADLSLNLVSHTLMSAFYMKEYGFLRWGRDSFDLLPYLAREKHLDFSRGQHS